MAHTGAPEMIASAIITVLIFIFLPSYRYLPPITS
jgi:hypothetical protein